MNIPFHSFLCSILHIKKCLHNKIFQAYLVLVFLFRIKMNTDIFTLSKHVLRRMSDDLKFL